MTSHALGARKAANQVHQCQVHRCGQRRVGLSHWCSAHDQIARRYGHPSAGPLKAKLWASHRKQVRELLDANEDHPGMQQATAWVQRWLNSAAQYTTAFKGAEEVQRLVRHGIAPKDILAEVCAVSLWLRETPFALPTDTARDFAISRAVFGLAPRERRRTRDAQGQWGSTSKPTSYSPKPKRSALAHVGKHLRQSLAWFISNVQLSLETLEQRKAEALAALQVPLRPPLDL